MNWTGFDLDRKPDRPLAVFAAEFSSAENPPKKVLLACLLVSHKLWTCDVKEICFCAELTAAHVCFAQTAEHFFALLLTGSDSSFLVYCVMCNSSAVFQPKILVVSRIEPYFTCRDNSAKPNISQNFFLAIPP